MSPPNQTRRLYTCGVLALLVLVGLLTIGQLLPMLQKRQRLLADAQAAHEQSDFRRALELSRELLESEPESVDGLRVAADSASRLGQTKLAISLLRTLEAAPNLKPSDYLLMGQVSVDGGAAAEAESYLRQAIAADPNFHPARVLLIQLLSIQCRTYEVLEHRYYLLQRQRWQREGLLQMAKPEDLVSSSELDGFLAIDPRNPRLLLAKARLARVTHEFDEAADWVRRALAASPALVDAHAELGLLMIEDTQSDEAIAAWEGDLPATANAHPDIWLVRGMFAKSRGEMEAAVRCFGESLSRLPIHRVAIHQLSIVLSSLNQVQIASELADQVRLHDELARAVDDIYDVPENIGHWQRGAAVIEALGRIHEAAAWYQTVANLDPHDQLAIEKTKALAARATRELPIVVSEANPALKLDFASYPLPASGSGQTANQPPVASSGSEIRFADVTSAREIDFRLVGADLPVHRARRIFEIFGAGIGVVDFDLDGWPDLYFAQGQSPNADGGGRADVLDQLYQNREGKTFKQVTSAAGVRNVRAGQGVAVGDFNNDGFDDLFVANVGENRLYQNNGDGTFQDVTSAAGITGSQWTTSCVIADLNGDTWPDIYEVNYLGGQEVLETVCRSRESAGSSCRPRDFPSAPDRFYLGLGDGRFSERTVLSGFDAPDGKGLGVVVGDFEGEGHLSVFVANDTTANHFYTNRAPRGALPEFEDVASLAGLGFDQNGLTQACMGVASDDVDSDGRLDLFVTNFHEEPNTLYLGRAAGYFEDASRMAGLAQSSYQFLGFGTQFLDADLDGDPDLVVANGHISDEGQGGAGFQMVPQFFENRGGRFVERDGTQAGSYFSRQLLGRALARLDFDRDGRDDFVVSHLDAPNSLLQNQTLHAGHYLAVRVVGVASDRNAIGTIVTVETPDGKKRVRQITSGDGYMCSNERTLTFGLGANLQVSKLSIRWPSGAANAVDDLQADRTLMFVEGRSTPMELHR